mmetsp:Transcript_174560/g.554039  ORF Transcript_174560/g.554039 Transcript_174560/m.554039 type:complete len:744 (-) Transcript_174560:317-2548(-)
MSSRAMGKRPCRLLLALFGASAAGVAAAENKPPNFLLLFPDQWRWDWAGFDKDSAELQMPTLQGIASHGTRYTYAYSPSPWCVPARACLASARQYGNAQDHAPVVVNGQDFPPDFPTWYKALESAGYHTMTTGKDDLTQSIAGTGRDGSRHAAELGFESHFLMQDKFATYPFKEPWDQFGAAMQAITPFGRNESGAKDLCSCNKWCYGVIAGPGACCHEVSGGGWNCPGADQVGQNQHLYVDDFVTAKGEALLDIRPKDKPWVLHVSFPGPHPPFIITEGMNESIKTRPFPVSYDNDQVSAEEQLNIRRSYASEIENIDKLFKRLLDKVEATGEMENTYVIVMSDHGEMLGDHNLFGKKVPWEASVHVPLIVKGPGVAAGRVEDTPVSTVSAIRFILDQAGAEMPHTVYKATLAKGAEESVEDLPIFSGLSTKDIDFRVVVKKLNDTHTMKVVCCPRGCPEGNSRIPSEAPDPQLMAFNIKADPQETTNLNGTKEAWDLAGHFEQHYVEVCMQDAAKLHLLEHKSKDPKLLIGQKVFLTSHRGEQLKDKHGQLGMSMNEDASEKWTMTDAGDGKVFLTSHRGQQLKDREGSAQPTGSKDELEKWTLEKADGGKVFITGQRGEKLQDFNGSPKVTPSADASELWTITRALADPVEVSGKFSLHSGPVAAGGTQRWAPDGVSALLGAAGAAVAGLAVISFTRLRFRGIGAAGAGTSASDGQAEESLFLAAGKPGEQLRLSSVDEA